MPARLIREGMIDSARVCALPLEARWLFVTICLCADDVGLFDAAPFALMRRAELQRDLGPQLLSMLADADLVRLYSVAGKGYGFLPRFRQRLQLTKMKHPAPPRSLVSDDPDAFNKINRLGGFSTVGQPRATDGQPPEAEAEGRDISSVASLQTPPRQAAKTAGKKVPPCPYERIVSAFHDVLPELPQVRLLDGRKPAIRKLWAWVLTSVLSTGKRRATSVEEGVTWFRGYFTRVRSNDFLMGRTPARAGHEGWRCDLDFLLTQKGLRQVIEKTEVTP